MVGGVVKKTDLIVVGNKIEVAFGGVFCIEILPKRGSFSVKEPTNVSLVPKCPPTQLPIPQNTRF